MTGIDDISVAIGRLQGSVEGIEAYIHDKRHEENNLPMVIDGVRTRLSREFKEAIAAIGMQIQQDAASNKAEIEGVKARVTLLEMKDARQDGALRSFDWLIRNPLVGWIIGAGAALYMFLAKKGDLP